jgi:hypothetical protein
MVAIAIIAGAGTAYAAPVDQHLGLAELQQMLDDAAGAPVLGYMKTVLQGSTIEMIPVNIIAITSDDLGASNASKALIVFEAGGKVDDLGGIASGMSGSPIYVDDSGTDKVVGALSYGDWFAKNGSGLATPIEAMLAVAAYPAAPALTMSSLQAPASTSAGLIKDVVITNDADIAAASRGKYTFVAKPLSAISIGALPPATRGYKALAKYAATRGYDVLPLVAPLGMSKSSFSVPFEPGTAVAALASWGDFWVGGIGTTTWVDSEGTSETVLAFGHPMDWDGSSQFALANAWIDYTWPSSISPWKAGRPGMVRGTVTQDRGAAILGKTNLMSKTTTITSHVTESSTGNTQSGTTYMPRDFATGDWSILPGFAAYSTALRACDDYWYKGSGVTTTTVVVNDGTRDYTIVRRNLWFSTWDAPWESLADPFMMVSAFSGIDDARVLSVDYQAAFDPKHVDARIVDVQALGGLKTGAVNVVRVSLVEAGNPATRTVDVTLTIPAGTPRTGEIVVHPASQVDGESGFEGEDVVIMETDSDRAQTTSEAVAALADQPLNSELAVSFSPMDPTGKKKYVPIKVSTDTPWYLTGRVSKETALFDLTLTPTTINYNDMVMLIGAVDGIYNDAQLKVYGRSVDSATTRLLGTVPISPDADEGYAEFEEMFFGLKKNTVITVVFTGDKNTLYSTASKILRVRASVGLRSSATRVALGKKVTLTTTLAPAGTRGRVAFQRYRKGAWRTFSTKTLSGGKAKVSFKPVKGTNKVRVKYLGGTVNAAKTSRTVTIKTR